MASGTSVRPWDDSALAEELLQEVVGLPRIQLSTVEAPRDPGVYVQFLSLDHDDQRASFLVEALGEPMCRGEQAAYVGVAATSLRSRIGRYRQSLRGVTVLGASDLYLACLPCRTRAGALWAEATLIEALVPPLNGSGWGAKLPGSKRAGQKPSPIDALIPGRSWARASSRLDEARSRLLLLARLAMRDPGGPAWPPLPRSAPT